MIFSTLSYQFTCAYNRHVTARTHDAAAITALGAALLIGPLPTITLATAIIALVANQLGGIAPDIDQPIAPFWRNLPIGGMIGRMITKMLGGHRFLTHSILGVAVFGFLTNLLLNFLHPVMPKVDIGFVWWAFMIGMVSHLLMDTLTKEGVPWLLPVPIKFGIPPIKAWRITTGEKIESLIIFPGILAFDIWFCAVNYQQILVLLHQHII
jgi:inner membrane protein